MTSIGTHAEVLAHRLKVSAARAVEALSPTEWGSLSSVRCRAPHFALTFDDGPTPERTTPIGRALEEHGATATFFVLMRNARTHPHLLRELSTAGHEIALHGADHRRLRSVPPEEFHALLGAAKEELEDLVGRPVRWYRPPYGEQTVHSWRAVKSLGLTTVLWSRTAWDWKDTDRDTRLRVACMRPTAGTIVLAHDGHAGVEDGADPVVEPAVDRYDLVSEILSAYAARGVTCRTVGQLVDSGDPVHRVHYVRAARPAA